MATGTIGLIIIGICVVLFITEWIPSWITGLLGCTLMVLLKVATFEEAFSGFSSSIVWLLFGAIIIGISMFDTGVAQLIGRNVIRLSCGREKLFLLISITVGGIMAAFLANTAVLAMFLVIIESVCRASPDMKRKNLTLPMSLAVMYGGAMTLIGCTPQLTANGIMQKLTGVEMGMWDLTRPGVLIFIVFIIYTMLFGYKRGKKIWSDRPETSMQLNSEDADRIMHKEYDKKKIIIMLVVVTFMMVFYVGAWITTVMTAMISALLCIIFGLTEVKGLVKKIDWSTLVFLAGCLGLGNALQVSGGGDIVASGFSKLLGDIVNPFVIFALLCFLCLFISQFITNSAAIMIVLPIALPICTAYGFNYMPFTLGITFAGSFAAMTPLAAAQIAMCAVAGYKFSDYFRFTLVLTIITYIAILVFVPLFYPLVG